MSNNNNNQGGDPQDGHQINIELGEKEAEGIYSNLAIISHSPAEFVIDFTRILPGVPRARVHARIVMTPQHARLLLNALEDNIEKFEHQYGEIPMNAGGAFGFPMSDNGEKIH